MHEYKTQITPVETGLEVVEFEAAIEAFALFTHLPKNIKEEVVYSGTPGRERNTKAGYTRKDAKDHKEIFHYTDAFAESYDQRNASAEVRDFLVHAEHIHRGVLRGLRKVLETHHPLLTSVHFPPNGYNNHHSRFAIYDEASPGSVIAGDHYDQSTLTMAGYETEPGLCLGTGPDDLEEYIRDPHESVLFPGFGWLDLHRQLGLTTDTVPAWHGARMPIRSQSRKIGRAVYICFANAAYIDTTPTKQQTATPLTDNDIRKLQTDGILMSPLSTAA